MHLYREYAALPTYLVKQCQALLITLQLYMYLARRVFD